MIYHQWINFLAEVTEPRESVSRLKTGYAEPEGWIERESEVILFECKLTGGCAGRDQGMGLYAPLLGHLLGKPVRVLLICRHITGDTPGPFIDSIEQFISSDLPFATWHYLI